MRGDDLVLAEPGQLGDLSQVRPVVADGDDDLVGLSRRRRGLGLPRGDDGAQFGGVAAQQDGLRPEDRIEIDQRREPATGLVQRCAIEQDGFGRRRAGASWVAHLGAGGLQRRTGGAGEGNGVRAVAVDAD